ncbi:MAG TPA: transglycosylase SLT domain-containing protein [Burkholderiaceae bacterium]|nr:transglycosylase SLT domain-containing protein [Burkholderiaceae bacterium]
MTSSKTAPRLRRALAAMLVGGLLQTASAQTTDLAVDAREALRRRDAPLLGALRERAVAQQHPLASWVDYWELGNRLDRAQQAELDAFYARWPGTYVEDRLRNDWLLELGRRRDWANLQREFPRFRMNDDREVTCYALVAEYLARDTAVPVAGAFKARALDAWFAPRDTDDGCQLLATTLVEAKVFGADDAWRRARLAAEGNRLRTARAAAALAAPALQAQVASALDKPALFLNAGATTGSRAQAEVTALALIRVAANEPEVAAAQMNERWQARLPRDLSAWVWAQIGRGAATRLQAEAPAHFRTAWAEAERANPRVAPAWSDDTLAWAVRAALRDTSSPAAERWLAVTRAVEHLSAAEQRDSAWRYWRARAQRELAAPGAAGDRLRTPALAELRQLATELHFYGKLAAEDLGQGFVVPPRPAPLTADERAAAARHAGLTRALLLVSLGLRSEGVREWNFSLRGMDDRALLAAAERACEAQVWDRCINTSERAREAVDLEQRFPMPFRDDVIASAKQIGLDPAYVYGLIRQESRFITDARSHVGASGLMQLMPATAKWTAKKVGLAYTPEAINDRNVNLKLGTSYLKLVLDDFGGSQALAAAAYNAGPSRPRRWREGALVEAAVWAENIPFAETRDYVKKVLSNATVYAALLAGQRQREAPPAVPAPAASAPLPAASDPASAPGLVPVVYTPTPPAPPPFVLPSLKARLGASIGPREPAAPPPDKELP